MPVTLTCKHCTKQYQVPPSRAAASNYCGRGCADAARSLDALELTCKACGSGFSAKAEGGVVPKYCCRACYLGTCIRSEQRHCEQCGVEFTARTSTARLAAGSDDPLHKYCGRECADAAKRKGGEYQCAHCGSAFYASPSRLERLGEHGCCSAKCQAEYFVGPRNKRWKGGRWVSEADNVVHLRLEPGRGRKHFREHRIVVARILGRQLEDGEVVLHINNDNSDNRPENLFLCGSRREAGFILGGSRPWPTASNLPVAVTAPAQPPGTPDTAPQSPPASAS